MTRPKPANIPILAALCQSRITARNHMSAGIVVETDAQESIHTFNVLSSI